jgi:cobaltochelatase CobN
MKPIEIMKYRPPLVSVPDFKGEIRQIPVVYGEVIVCKGCCCGDTERGYPEVPLEEYESQWLNRGLAVKVHLTISGCLGICSVPNVVMILFGGHVVTLHSIVGHEDVTAIFDYVKNMADAERFFPIPAGLAERQLARFIGEQVPLT